MEKKPPLLEDAAISVVKGENGALFRKLFDAVVGKGFGSEIEKRKYEEFLKTFDVKDHLLQSEIRKLSSNSRFLTARNSGHGKSRMFLHDLPSSLLARLCSVICMKKFANSELWKADIQLTEPQLIVGEVKWVISQYQLEQSPQ